MVDTVTVTRQVISTDRDWVGIVAPLRKASVVAPEPSIVAELFVNEGDWVDKGASLMRLKNPQLDARKSVLQERRNVLIDDLARWQRLAGANAAGPGEVEAARLRLLEVEKEWAELNARRQLLNLTAPVSGRVTHLTTLDGATVTPGVPLMMIDDINSPGLRLRIPIAEAAYFETPDKLTLSFANGETGAIERIIATTQENTPNFIRLEIWLAEQKSLTPTQARLQYSDKREAILIPWTAVAREDDAHWVAVVQGEPLTIARRRVELGAGRAQGVEVKSGLEDGERILRFEPRAQPEGREVALHSNR